ncbi:uracil-DNA glycosylase [Minwuia thermotolerans]|uniref:Type-4 uracil-DNA glycosylase n=1 Tax=Minwuia thermotolerans TaxID=2056226 RepID=A0A2M9FVP8_9PROT|nr:uracil-DNA glycosylase [Minwuia thermotolerans]PJK27542.1 uracil-DNA glycosylase [Minwuia thermotolerans]
MDDREARFKSDLAVLQFYVDAGVDVAIEAEPHDRLAPPPPVPAPQVEDVRPARVVTAGTPRQTPASEIDSDRRAVASAQRIAPACETLEDLRAALEQFEGLAIRQTATQLVFADGNPEAEIMIIGEAPGREEDRHGKPFIGEAGRLLDRMLGAIGLDRDSVYITNTILWRPPGNRKPNPAEIQAMLPFLKRHIELVRPKVMVLAGGTALSALYDVEARITRERGKWRVYEASFGPAPVLPIFHPAYLLRNPAAKKESWSDLLALQAKCAELGITGQT